MHIIGSRQSHCRGPLEEYSTQAELIRNLSDPSHEQDSLHVQLRLDETFSKNTPISKSTRYV
jgi:hypothetical protein